MVHLCWLLAVPASSLLPHSTTSPLVHEAARAVEDGLAHCHLLLYTPEVATPTTIPTTQGMDPLATSLASTLANTLTSPIILLDRLPSPGEGGVFARPRCPAGPTPAQGAAWRPPAP